MVKAYLRYEPRLVFGVITSLESNIAYDSAGKHILAPALDRVALWDPRRGELSRFLSPQPSSPQLAVSTIAASPGSPLVASGHRDGSVRLWDLTAGTCEATFNGHRSTVSALQFNSSGSLLASGGKDCDIILWDVVGEAGLFRLRGHRDQVTDLVFVDSDKKLVSCSKDKFIRVWDLDLQQCIQTIGGHHTEIWSLDVSPDERYLVSGSADQELRVFQVRKNVKETDGSSKWDVLTKFGDIQRRNKDRVGTLRFSRSGSILACQAAGRVIEFYHVLGDVEAKKKAKRRLRRKKDKLSTKDNDQENGFTKIDSYRS